MLPLLHRRSFLKTSFVGTACIGGALLCPGQVMPTDSAKSPVAPARKEPNRGDPLDAAVVKAFVTAGHRDLPKVQELLAAHPTVLNASVDLGRGDWESALGAAAHSGNQEIARFLLEAGVRPDLFSAAMLGEREVVKSTIRFTPHASNARGPHGLTLMYHLGYSGEVGLAEVISPHLTERAVHCNQAVLSATALGRVDFVAWLLRHGVDNPNLKAFGKTPLDLALEKGFDEIARLLREHGGTTGG